MNKNNPLMDKKLQIVERLYEGSADGSAGHPMGPDDRSDLQLEYQAMSQAKFWLDHRRPQRPDPSTIDDIVEAAARAATGDLPRGVRADRSPLRLLRGTPLQVGIAAALAMIAISIGIWRNTGDAPLSSEPAAQTVDKLADNKFVAPPSPASEGFAAMEKEEQTPASELDPAAPGRARLSGKDSAGFGNRGNEPAAVLASSEVSDIPDWGHPDELVQIKQRIEQLRARQSDLGWDRPLVPLEMMPSGSGSAGIRQAGAKQE